MCKKRMAPFFAETNDMARTDNEMKKIWIEKETKQLVDPFEGIWKDNRFEMKTVVAIPFDVSQPFNEVMVFNDFVGDNKKHKYVKLTSLINGNEYFMSLTEFADSLRHMSNGLLAGWFDVVKKGKYYSARFVGDIYTNPNKSCSGCSGNCGCKE